MTMRLLFVVNDPRFFISHRLPIAVAARAAGYDVHLAAPRMEATEAELARAGIVTHDLPLERRTANPFGELRTLFALVGLYARLRPDIVHHVTVKPVIYGSIAARLTRVPAVVNAVCGLGHVFVSSGVVAHARRIVVRALYRVGFRHPRLRAIFQNLDDLETFVRLGIVDRGRSELIRGSGVNLDRFTPAPLPSGVPIVLLPARLLWEKGVREFIDAARQLITEGLDARFVMAGRTEEHRAFVSARELRELQEAGVVEWWGECDDMPRALRDATVVCLPSYREGTPKALLEAAACGRPMITTNVPGCRDVVDDGVHGMLVPPRDSAALAGAIRAMLVDAPMRERMALAARTRAVAEFGVAPVVNATLALYDDLQSNVDLAVATPQIA